MARLLDLTDADFDARLGASPVPVLVAFEARGCPACDLLEPELEALADRYRARLRVARIDVDAHPRSARAFGIRSVPTLVLFRRGSPVDGAKGALPLDSLVEMVELHVGRRPGA